MQIKFENITTEWVALSDIITVSEDVTYFIQNRGYDILVALESSSEPSDDTEGGVLISPYIQAIYKKDEQELYLRAFSNTCSLNITSGGAND